MAVTLNAAFDRSEAHVWQEGNRAKTSGSIGFSMSDECFITLSSHIADGGAITAFYTFPQDFALIHDFYGFNRGGRWPVAFAAMIGGAAAACVLLWVM